MSVKIMAKWSYSSKGRDDQYSATHGIIAAKFLIFSIV